MSEDPIVHAASGHHIECGSSLGRRQKDDLETAAVGQWDALVEIALAAEGIESSGNSPGILTALARLPLEFVDLFQDLDRDENVVVLKVEQRVRVVEQDVGIENVVLDTIPS